MGEIAEAMLNGLFCEGCGELIDGDEPGFPRYCCKACKDGRVDEDEEEENDQD